MTKHWHVCPVLIIAVLLPAVVGAIQDQPAPQRVKLNAPAGARIVSFDNYGFGIVPEFQSIERSASGGHVRLDTAIRIQEVIDHYVPQLSAVGWRTTLRQIDPTLGLVRFSVGRDADPLTGLLVAIPFPTTGQTIVSVRLVRSRMPWNYAARRGSGGANERGVVPAASILFYAFHPQLTFPDAVLRSERRDGGGQPDIRYSGARVETFMTVPALSGALEPQFPSVGWTTTARLGDPVQTAIRRTSPDGKLSEVLIVTALPAAREIDVAGLLACSTEQPCADWRR